VISKRENQMAFMKPYYSDDEFVRVEDSNGESELIPAGYEMLQDGSTITERYIGKIFCRLSASGYMDCTSWDGPYDTLEAAKTAIIDTWDVDPDTGDELTQTQERAQCL